MALGARVGGTDPLTGGLSATLPRGLLPAVRAWPEVVAVRPAAPPLNALNVIPAITGADTWWNAGHTGGTGTADVPTLTGGDAPDLIVTDVERIAEDHPAFAGLRFQSPPAAPPTCVTPSAPACLHPSEVLAFAGGGAVAACPIATSYSCGSRDLDPTPKGTAPGLETVLDDYDVSAISPRDGFDGIAWALGIRQVGRLTHTVLPGASDPGEVHNESLGSGNTAGVDDLDLLQATDQMVSTFGLFSAIACGNDGPAPKTVNIPGIAYNDVCVGAYNAGTSASDTSDDAVDSWSSRGPTPAGRKKPDLVALGGGSGANALWRTSGSLWNGVSGTSFASPQVAGAALLLMGSGISDPLAVKAMLIDSARPGRATPDQAMGTQTGWQPDWGWGALDLASAFTQRTNFTTATVPSNGVRFYRATTQASGDRATLVWNRRVGGTGFYEGTPTAQPLANLDLAEYDAASGALRGVSASSIDNVEQVRSPGPGEVVYKVMAGTVQGATTEPYALAATRQVTPLTSPQPQVTTTLTRLAGRQGDEIGLSVTVRNPSRDLAGDAFTLDVAVPSGLRVEAGPDGDAVPQTLAPGASVTRTYRLRALADGSQTVRVSASDAAYGSVLTTSDATTVNVDSVGAAPAITVPAGSSGDPRLGISWTGSDPAGVVGYDVDASVDGGPWSSWLRGVRATDATYSGEPGHAYRFRARLLDALGNVSSWTESAPVRVPAPPAPAPQPPPGPVPPAAAPRPRDPRLRLAAASLERRGRQLLVRGYADPGVSLQRLRLTISYRQRGRLWRVSRPVSSWAGVSGAWTARVPLPVVPGSTTRLLAVLRYPGEPGLRPAAVRRTLVRLGRTGLAVR